MKKLKKILIAVILIIASGLIGITVCIRLIGIYALKTAINSWDLSHIERVLEYGVPVDGAFGFCPVLYAWKNTNNTVIMEFLLQNGADPNACDAAGNTLLMISLGAGNHNVVHNLDFTELFVKYGADINIPNGSGMTPLNYAVKHEKIWAIPYLLKQGARVERDTLSLALEGEYGRGYCNYLTLQNLLAEFYGEEKNPLECEEVVEYLSDLDDMYALAFYTAAFGSAAEMSEFGLKDDEYLITDCNGATLLHTAAACGNTDVLRFLLDTGVYQKQFIIYMSEVQYPLMRGAFHNAVSSGNIESIKMFLDEGVSFLPEYDDYDNPILAAGSNVTIEWLDFIKKHGCPLSDITIHLLMEQALDDRRLEIIQYFLDAGFFIDHNSKDNHETLLFHAVKKGDYDAVSYLLDCGADVNALPYVILTAAKQNDCKMVYLLLDAGADINARGIEGTAVDICKEYGYSDLLEYLEGI